MESSLRGLGRCLYLINLVTLTPLSHNSYQIPNLPFNSCWNVPPYNNHITRRHIELAYQFILPSTHSLGINLRKFPFNFPSILSAPSLFLSHILSETATFHHIYCVLTYINFLPIEKDNCHCRNISIKLPYVYVSFFFNFSFLQLHLFSDRK